MVMCIVRSVPRWFLHYSLWSLPTEQYRTKCIGVEVTHGHSQNEKVVTRLCKVRKDLLKVRQRESFLLELARTVRQRELLRQRVGEILAKGVLPGQSPLETDAPMRSCAGVLYFSMQRVG